MKFIRLKVVTSVHGLPNVGVNVPNQINVNTHVHLARTRPTMAYIHLVVPLRPDCLHN